MAPILFSQFTILVVLQLRLSLRGKLGIICFTDSFLQIQSGSFFPGCSPLEYGLIALAKQRNCFEKWHEKYTTILAFYANPKKICALAR